MAGLGGGEDGRAGVVVGTGAEFAVRLGCGVGEGGFGVMFGGAGQGGNDAGVVDDEVELAVAHLDDFINVFDHAQVAGDHDAGAILFVNEAGEGFDDLEGAFGVEGGSGFVGEDDGGVVDEGASNGDALALAARELAGEVVHAVGQAEAGEQFAGAGFVGFVEAAIEAQHQFDVLERSVVGDEVVGLEGETDVFAAEGGQALVGEGGEVFAIDIDLAGRGPQQPGEDGEEGGFARPAGADQGDEFAGAHPDGDVVHGADDRPVGVVGFFNGVSFKGVGHGYFFSCSDENQLSQQPTTR